MNMYGNHKHSKSFCCQAKKCICSKVNTVCLVAGGCYLILLLARYKVCTVLHHKVQLYILRMMMMAKNNIMVIIVMMTRMMIPTKMMMMMVMAMIIVCRKEKK